MSTLRTAEPSLRSRWLGRHLRALREDHGFVLRHVERTLGLPYAEIKAVEQGMHHIHVSQVDVLLELYGVDDRDERDQLLELARDVRQLTPWEVGSDAPMLSPSMLDHLWLESRAREIRCYSATLIPDLLQIPEYAEAVARQNGGKTVFPQQASWWGWACTERQRVLDDPPQATLHAVIAESALSRPVNRSFDVIHQQLHHLAKAAVLPHITLQVLPVAAPYLAGMDGSFDLFALAPPRGPVATARTSADPVIHEERLAAQYARTFEQLSQVALDPEASAELITEAAERSSN